MQADDALQDAPEKRSRGRKLPAAAFAVAAAWAVLWYVATRHAWSQTGYLHLAFARSLARGEGFGVQGRPVFGDDSPLWVGLLAGCHRVLQAFTPNWLAAGKTLTVAAAVFSVAGLGWFAQGLLPSAAISTRRALSTSVVTVTVLSPYWGLEAFSGTEVLAAAGLACWAGALVAGSFPSAIRPRRLLAACACAGFGPLLRPEMLFFSVCLAPFLFVRWVNTPQRFRERVLIFFAGLLLAVGPGAVWLLWTVRQFGTGLPNTIGAGAASPDASVLWGGIVRVGVGAPWLPVAFGSVGLLPLLQRRKRRRDPNAVSALPWAKLDPTAWLPVASAGLTVLFYLGTHTAVTSRDVLLLAPACTASAFALASLFLPWSVWVGGLACALYGLLVSFLFAWPAIAVELGRERVYAQLAQAIEALPATERVALAPAGEVLFLSAHPGVDRGMDRVVDLGGTLDPSAAAFRWQVTDAERVWWAHGQGARAMVLDHSPEPGSTALWSGDLPAASSMAWPNGGEGSFRTSDRLVLWRLPPSPTLPPPAALPPHPE